MQRKNLFGLNRICIWLLLIISFYCGVVLARRRRSPSTVVMPPPETLSHPEALSGSLSQTNKELFVVNSLPSGAIVSYVDIIITVKTNIKFVRSCVNALLRHAPDPTVSPYLEQRVVFVDDGSPLDTITYQQSLCHSNTLFDNGMFYCTNTSGKQKGYTWAVDKGINHLKARGHVESVAVVLLNSDTIVTSGWLTNMYRSLTKSPSNMIVGPLSNAATWQSVPHPQVIDNTIPLGLGVDNLAREIHAFATEEKIAEVPIFIINGFCFMFKRELLSHIGGFDTRNFGPGYGEEVDFCLRAFQNGFVALIDPSTYIFHTKTASFPSTEKKQLNLKSHKILDAKYGKILEKYKTEKFVSRKKLSRAINNVDHVYKMHSKLYSKFRRPNVLFIVSCVATPMGDLISLLKLVFYLQAQQVLVWVELHGWDADRVRDDRLHLTIGDFLLIHFPDLSPNEGEIIFTSSADQHPAPSSSSPSSSAAIDSRTHSGTHSGSGAGRGVVIKSQAYALADVIVATSMDTVPTALQFSNSNTNSNINSGSSNSDNSGSNSQSAVSPSSSLSSPHSIRHSPARAVYMANDFPVLSSYATSKEHEKYVSYLKQFSTLNKSVTVLSRSQWVIDTASQENFDIDIQKIASSIDHNIFYISPAELHMKSKHKTFRIMVRFRGSRSIDQTILHSMILLLQQTDIKIKFRILNVPSVNYINELCSSLIKDITLTSSSSRSSRSSSISSISSSAISSSSSTISDKESFATTLAEANIEYVSYTYTESMHLMGQYYRESDVFVDASELKGSVWALQRSVLESQACGCMMALPTGSMAQSIADNNVDECLVFETTKANKLRKQLVTFLQNDQHRLWWASSVRYKATEYSCEEDGLFFLDKVSALQPARTELSAFSEYFTIISSGVGSLLFYFTLLVFLLLLLCLVYKMYVRPNGKMIKLYSRFGNNNTNEKE